MIMSMHVETQPLGSISFQESNQIGSVVPVPWILKPDEQSGWEL